MDDEIVIKKLARIMIEKMDYTVIKNGNPDYYMEDGLISHHNCSDQNDPAFKAAYARGKAACPAGSLLYGPWRVHTALWAAGQAMRLEGEFVECGVNWGFMSSAIMKYYNWNSKGRKFYLMDTFGGLVDSQINETESVKKRQDQNEKWLKSGIYVTDVAPVKKNFSEWDRVIFVQGLIPDTLSQVDAQKISYLHLDMNCAYPEVQALRYFWDRIVHGGIILLDDFAYHGYEAQHVAITELCKELGTQALSLPTGQGLIVKN